MLWFVDEEGLQQDPVSLLPHTELLGELGRSRPDNILNQIFCKNISKVLYENILKDFLPDLSGELWLSDWSINDGDHYQVNTHVDTITLLLPSSTNLHYQQLIVNLQIGKHKHSVSSHFEITS